MQSGKAEGAVTSEGVVKEQEVLEAIEVSCSSCSGKFFGIDINPHIDNSTVCVQFGTDEHQRCADIIYAKRRNKDV